MGAEYDELVDRVAEACVAEAPAALTRLFAHDDLAVPQDMAG